MNKNYPNIISVLILFLAIFTAYFWSFNHFHRADQWCYLIDTMENNDLIDIFQSSYSYNRTRLVLPGDTRAFRPAFFLFLSIQKAFLGNNIILWQQIGVLLHFMICVLLLFIMQLFILIGQKQSEALKSKIDKHQNKIRWLVFSIVLFFALNPNIIEAVVWSHINGYLLFYFFVCLCLFLSCKIILRIITEPDKFPWHLFSVFWGSSVAVIFLYELGQLYCLIVGFLIVPFIIKYSLRHQKLTSVIIVFALLLLPVIYNTVNYIDRLKHLEAIKQDKEIGRITKSFSFSKSAENSFRLINYTTLSPLFPKSTKIATGEERIVLMEKPFYKFKNHLFNYISIFLLVVCTMWMGSSLFYMLKEHNFNIFLFVASLGLLYIMYIGMSVFGRMNIRGQHGFLYNNSYYAYWPLLLYLLTLFVTIINFPDFNIKVKSVKMPDLFITLAVIFVIFSCYGGQKLYKANKKHAEAFVDKCQFTRLVSNFIKKHGKKEGFSIAFDLKQTDRVTLPLNLGVPMSTILFRKYENNKNPLYVLWFRDGKLFFQKTSEYRKKYNNDMCTLFPSLVSVGTYFNIFNYGDEYYAVLVNEGAYDPDRHDYSFLIQGEIIQEVEYKKMEYLKGEISPTPNLP